MVFIPTFPYSWYKPWRCLLHTIVWWKGNVRSTKTDRPLTTYSYDFALQ